MIRNEELELCDAPVVMGRWGLEDMTRLNIHVANRICSAGVGIIVMRPRVSSFPEKTAVLWTNYYSDPHTHTLWPWIAHPEEGHTH